MRYPPEHKDASRRRIVTAAAKAFREQGVDGPSVSAIMADAGLTVGGFYRHFDSKDELFAEALDQALSETLAMLRRDRERAEGGTPPAGSWRDRAAAVYLTPQHRSLRGAGCPLPELTAEVGRRDEATRRRFEQSLEAIVDEIAGRLDTTSSDDARQQAWGFLSTLVGSLLLSRGVASDDVADQILAAGRRAAGQSEA